MRNHSIRLLLLPITGLVAIGALAPAAGADPRPGGRNGFPVDVTCDGVTFHAIGSGNGEFTPVHDTASTSMLIPVSFGAFTGTVRDADGNIVAVETDPDGSAKGQSAHQRGLVDCTFSFTFVNDGSDPEFPAGYSFTGEGSVVGKVTPLGR